MDINISNGIAPTGEEIQSEVVKLKGKFRRYCMLAVIATIPLLLSIALIVPTSPEIRLQITDQMFNSMKAMIGFSSHAKDYCWLFLGMAFVWVPTALWEEAHSISSKISSFSPIGKQDCVLALELCQSNSYCEAYRKAVVVQGRRLTKAEAKAMKEWVAIGEAAESAEITQVEACVRLHS
ncbi:MAG: hypothetical protein ACLQF0_12485 [Dissulfurispiraceae bacterium]